MAHLSVVRLSMVRLSMVRLARGRATAGFCGFLWVSHHLAASRLRTTSGTAVSDAVTRSRGIPWRTPPSA